MLQLIQYKKNYEKQAILNIENVLFYPGIYWLQGINGSGKSTLLKTIAGWPGLMVI